MSKTNIRRIVTIFIMIAIVLTGIYFIKYGGYKVYNAKDKIDIYEKFNQNYDIQMVVYLNNLKIDDKTINFKFVRKIDKTTDHFKIEGYYNNKKIYEENSRTINFDIKEANGESLIFIDTGASVGQLGEKVVIFNNLGEEIFNMIMNKYSFDKNILTLDEFEVDETNDDFGKTSPIKYKYDKGKFKRL